MPRCRPRRSDRGSGSPSSCFIARLFGTRAVSDLVTALEGDEEDMYESQSSPEVADIAADEREHAEIWRQLKTGEKHRSARPTTSPRASAGIARAGPECSGR